MNEQQQIAMQNSQQQAEQAAQAAQQAQQGRMQEMQAEGQLKNQEIQLKAQLEMQMAQMQHEFNKEIETIRAQATLGFKEDDQNFKEKLDVLKEDRKDTRQEAQGEQQMAMIQMEQQPEGQEQMI